MDHKEKETLAESAANSAGKFPWKTMYPMPTIICIDEIPSQETVCPLASLIKVIPPG